MANLRANKITSTEIFETTGSVQFDGSGDYLSIANSGNDFKFGTADFTIEMWINPNTVNTSSQTDGLANIVDFDATVGFGSNAWFAIHQGNSTIVLAYSGANRITSTSFLTSNTWFHIALVRYNGTFTIYANGVSVGSLTETKDFSDALSRSLFIGKQILSSNERNFNGHISNLRIIKGRALYTSNFTPPIRELEVIPNTVLLCCQSKTRANEEKTGKTITVNGNAVANELTPGLLTNIVKSGGSSAITGSVEFDGTGDYLTTPSTSDFSYGTGDFTWEMWLYSADIDVNRYVLDHGSNGGVIAIGSGIGSGSRYFNSSTGVSSVLFTTGFGSINANSWYHFAVVRSNGTTSLYKNGILISSASDTHNYGSQAITIGSYGSPDPTQYYWKGFISNLRVIKGRALYTSNFIPPTRKLTRVPGTVLLCCNNSTSVTSEATGKTITANGNPTARKFVPQVGSDGSVEFKGPTKINTPNYFYLPTGPTEQRGRGRGILAGGNTGSTTNKIDYISIQSSGTSQDFGDLNTIVSGPGGGVSSSTRGIIGGGITSPSININNIDYVTIAVTSNAIDFGDLIEVSRYLYGGSSNIRGLFGGGLTPSLSNVIQYVTIASVGNAQDFGDLTSAKGETGSCSSNTRCLWGGGNPGTNVIEYVTISSTGNAQDFGDLTQARLSMTACSSPTRGVFGGGYIGSPVFSNVIDYVTISSTGNAQDFGDLTAPRFGLTSVSNSIRGVFCGGQQPSFVNTMEFVLISSTGNVSDFGDLYLVTATPVGCSDSHGGLG